jgi:hypothetical protein
MNTLRTSLINGLLFPLALALAVPAAAEARREPHAGPAEPAARQDWRLAETRRQSTEGPAEPAARQDWRLAETRRQSTEGPAESAARQDWRLAETRRKSSEGPAEPGARQGLWGVSASLQSSRRVASELALQSAQRRLV